MTGDAIAAAVTRGGLAAVADDDRADRPRRPAVAAQSPLNRTAARPSCDV